MAILGRFKPSSWMMVVKVVLPPPCCDCCNRKLNGWLATSMDRSCKAPSRHMGSEWNFRVKYVEWEARIIKDILSISKQWYKLGGLVQCMIYQLKLKLTTFRHAGGHDKSNKRTNEAWNVPFQFALFKRSSELRRGKLRLVALSRMPRQADADWHVVITHQWFHESQSIPSD